jgi:hypothetical protein
MIIMIMIIMIIIIIIIIVVVVVVVIIIIIIIIKIEVNRWCSIFAAHYVKKKKKVMTVRRLSTTRCFVKMMTLYHTN